MLLALDTATRMAGIALYDQVAAEVLAEEIWYSTNNHTVELMPRLVRLIDQQGVTPADLDGLVVCLGPGSFTGLRIGLGVAKGLALACEIPIAGIPTLDVIAHPHTTQPLPIWALVRAGRGRICTGLYMRSRGRARQRWRLASPYELMTLEELCTEVEGPAFFCGEINAADAEFIQQRLGAAATIATPAASVRRPAYLAELGWERLGQGDADEAEDLAPIYLHHPQIDA